ncbi:YhgE/Pip domain-containing protein [Metaclostridioides mangenotii]|uniref:YhgE/Pip domain-containing protein n=1 Tax=Metaclostridioides mangenotii TaxID=1540 RepID=UPI002FE6DDFA
MRFLKNILEIFKGDLKDIKGNYTVLVIVIGLALLPSLYAWFNIEASWDPYGNTKNMKVAITNKDKGTEISNQKINVGDQLMEKLHENDSLGWQFVDEKTALKGVKTGEYYASVVIPGDFSKDLTSLITSDVKKGTIIYTVNEKINAIAPKITEKGASTIQLQVNQTVVKTVSEIILGFSNEIGVGLEKELPKLSKVENSLKDLQGKFSNIDKTMNTASKATSKLNDTVNGVKNDLPTIKNTINDTKNLSNDIKGFLQDTNNNVNRIAPLIKSDLNLIVDISSSASTLTSDLVNAVNNGSEDANKILDNINNKLSSTKSLNQTLLDFVRKLDELSSLHSFTNVINKLENMNSKVDSAISTVNEIKGQIASGQKPSVDSLNNLKKICDDIGSLGTDLLNNFDRDILNPINSIFEGGVKVANDIIDVLNKAENKLPKVEEILTLCLDISNDANDTVKLVQDKLPVAKGMVDEIIGVLDKINNSEDMQKLVELLESDILSKSEFLKEPVKVDTKKLYPIDNYGAAMTPFYSVLSTWVGILLLSALLTTSVKGDYKPYEAYFGRALTFLSIALVQGFIIGVGDILLLGVKMVHPILFVLLLMFTSMVFNFIVYSLVSVFGNIGKAMAIILLVLQIAAAGGTFPIQVTPKFFQVLNPLLPFTYAISASREALGGIYMPNLIKDLIAMVIFMLLAIGVNVFLKGPINKFGAPLKEKFGQSRLTGH